MIANFIMLVVFTMVFGGLTFFYDKKWLHALFIICGLSMMYTSVQLFNQESRWPSFIGLGVILLLSIFYMDKKLTPMPMIFLLLFCIWGNVLGFKYGMTGPLVIASIVEFFCFLGVALALAGANKPSEYDSEYYAEMYDGPIEKK